MSKNKGKGSKKVSRRERAQERALELQQLSPKEREARFAQNKARYDAQKASK